MRIKKTITIQAVILRASKPTQIIHLQNQLAAPNAFQRCGDDVYVVIKAAVRGVCLDLRFGACDFVCRNHAVATWFVQAGSARCLAPGSYAATIATPNNFHRVLTMSNPASQILAPATHAR